MTVNQTIREVIETLDRKKFAEGFEDTIPQRVRNAIHADFGKEESNKFWSAACNALYNPKRLVEYIDDPELTELYLRVAQESSDRSTFVMPDWGTSGT